MRNSRSLLPVVLMIIGLMIMAVSTAAGGLG
jgi:hypothetical protein